MKRMKLILPVFLLTMVIYACDSSKTNPVINSDPGAPSIVSPQPGESFTLTEEAAEDTLLVIDWTEPDFGFEAAPTYTVRMEMPAADSDPINLGSTSKTSFPIITGDFNTRLLATGAVGGSQTDVSFRIVSKLGDTLEEEVSESVTVQFFPFAFELEIPEIFVPGSYQSAAFYGNDWTPEDAPPLASENSDDRYEGFVYFDSPNTFFKFTLERNWDVNWGDDGADGTLDQNGADIEEAAGFFLINVDLNNLTYTTTRTEWGVIGDATPDGWDADQDMTYVPEDKVWRITLDLVTGEMKFRANDAWDINFGDDEQDGKLDFGGANIPVPEAGNYTVEMDLSNPPDYTFTLQLN